MLYQQTLKLLNHDELRTISTRTNQENLQEKIKWT